MKSISSKFRIDITTYVFFLIAFLSGMFKRVLYLFFIVCFHEMGHVFFIKLCKYKVLEVVIFPFGGITKVDHKINESIKKEMVISMGGVLFQAILEGIISFISFADKDLFLFYNHTIMLFNMIPIIPLDGSVFFHLVLESFFSFEESLRFYEVVSVISLVAFIIYNYVCLVENYFICMVLLVQFILYLKQKKYYIKRFYLERYLGDFPYKQIKNEVGSNYHTLKKNTRHYFYNGKKYETEREILAKVFDKRTYF